MSRTTMLHYLMQNGWRRVSFNYVTCERDPTQRPVEIVQAYVTQRHRERIAAYEQAQLQLEQQEA